MTEDDTFNKLKRPSYFEMKCKFGLDRVLLPPHAKTSQGWYRLMKSYLLIIIGMSKSSLTCGEQTLNEINCSSTVQQLE